MTGWPEDQLGTLRMVEKSIATLEASLRSNDTVLGVAAADDLVFATAKLLEDLDHSPSYQPETDAELVAALRVFQNAAFVFRRMAGITGEPEPGLAEVCTTMIEQGRDHYRAFAEQEDPTPDDSGSDR